MNLSHAVGVVLASLFERRLAALGLEELAVGQDVQGECLDRAQPRLLQEMQSARASGDVMSWPLNLSPPLPLALPTASRIQATRACSQGCSLRQHLSWRRCSSRWPQ